MYGVSGSTSPLVLAGDVKRTGTKVAYRRVGNVTTYEWAIQPFDRYPLPTHQVGGSGSGLGSMCAVVDKDAPSLAGTKGDSSLPGSTGGPPVVGDEGARRQQSR